MASINANNQAKDFQKPSTPSPPSMLYASKIPVDIPTKILSQPDLKHIYLQRRSTALLHSLNIKIHTLKQRHSTTLKPHKTQSPLSHPKPQNRKQLEITMEEAIVIANQVYRLSAVKLVIIWTIHLVKRIVTCLETSPVI